MTLRVQTIVARVPLVFWLLAFINLLVGGMVGLERTVVPLLGADVFALREGTALAAFVISFGLSKALFNLFAGALADRFGRRWVLIIGWVLGLPIPLLLIWAPNWDYVIAANVLLGVNQALTWSMTLNMMVDLVPPQKRGFAVGINEFAGYLGVSLLAFLTGVVAAATNLRPEPFYLGIGVVGLGLVLALLVPETRPNNSFTAPAWVKGVGLPSLLGLMTNLKDGLVWLALPLLLAVRDLDLVEIGLVTGLYPLVWAAGQVLFGPLSDRVGRWTLILPGMMLQGLGLLLLGLTPTYLAAVLASLLLGLGTGMAYPTLIAVVADSVDAQKRATALGIYRFFRDGGYAVGAMLAGLGLTVLPAMMTGVAVVFLLFSLLAWGRLRSAPLQAE